MKITVVGAGSVGASCAEYIAIKNFASEVVLVDIKKDFAVTIIVTIINSENEKKLNDGQAIGMELRYFSLGDITLLF